MAIVKIVKGTVSLGPGNPSGGFTLYVPADIANGLAGLVDGVPPAPDPMLSFIQVLNPLVTPDFWYDRLSTTINVPPPGSSVAWQNTFTMNTTYYCTGNADVQFWFVWTDTPYSEYVSDYFYNT